MKAFIRGSFQGGDGRRVGCRCRQCILLHEAAAARTIRAREATAESLITDAASAALRPLSRDELQSLLVLLGEPPQRLVHPAVAVQPVEQVRGLRAVLFDEGSLQARSETIATSTTLVKIG